MAIRDFTNKNISKKLLLKPYERSDREKIFKLLLVLPSLYPKGWKWLDKRLSDISDGKADCTIATIDKRPVGVVIETPKGKRRKKISTIYIDEYFRNCGIGNDLLYSCHKRWVESDLEYIYVTADSKISVNLLPLLSKFGFSFESLEYARYGADRHETVFSWTRS